MQNDDAFIAEYATAVIEREFNTGSCSLSVSKGVITVCIRNLTEKMQKKIVESLSGIPGVVRVEISLIEEDQWPDSAHVKPAICKVPENVFLPKGHLFAPLLADQRWPHFSAGFHSCIDNEEFDYIGAVSFGERFALYQRNLPSGRQWGIGIEAAVFSVFDMGADSFDLINSDFWVAFPSISYRDRNFSALFRLYHQSSHVGDEYFLRCGVVRKDLSYEVVNLLLSYDLLNLFRVYGGGGYMYHRTPSDIDPWLTQLGFEFESPRTFLNGAVRPIAAVDMQCHDETGWNMNFSMRTGIQFESINNRTRMFQIMLEYYNGYAPTGQFYDRRVEYMGIGTHLYF